MNQELENYIKESRNSGFTDEQMKQELKKAGWQDEIINQHFGTGTVPMPPINVSKPEKKSFVYYYIKCFKNYINFKGRASRREYWSFVLGNMLIFSIFASIYAIIFGNVDDLELNIVSIVFSLIMFLPSLAVFVRRLQDTNHSGSWWFFGLVPIVGPVVLFLFTIRVGLAGDNKYGPDPEK